MEKSNPDFSTVPTALGNPARGAGFPHFLSHDGGGDGLPLKTKPLESRVPSDSCVERKIVWIALLPKSLSRLLACDYLGGISPEEQDRAIDRVCERTTQQELTSLACFPGLFEMRIPKRCPSGNVVLTNLIDKR